MLKRFSGNILYLLITVLVLSLYLDHHGALEKYELKIQDLMFKFRGKSNPGNEVVIVAIDDRALGQYGHWPWNRQRMGDLIHILASAEPKVIALDLPLPFYDSDDTASGGKQLAEEIKKAGNVVLPISFAFSEWGVNTITTPPYVTSSAYLFYGEEYKFQDNPPVRAREIHFADASLCTSAKALGYTNAVLDKDGKVRREPLIVNFEGFYYPPLALQAARLYMNLTRREVKIEIGEQIEFGSTIIPIDKQGRMLVAFRGPVNTFRYLSAGDILSGHFEPKALKNKLILVGLTASGLTQLYKTAMGPGLPQVEKTANVAENILHKHFISRLNLSVTLDLFILIGIGVFCAVVLPRVTLMYRIVILCVFLFAIINLNFVLFASFNLLPKAFYPSLELIFFLLASPAIKPKRLKEEFGEEPYDFAYPSYSDYRRGYQHRRSEEDSLDSTYDRFETARTRSEPTEEGYESPFPPDTERNERTTQSVETAAIADPESFEKTMMFGGGAPPGTISGSERAKTPSDKVKIASDKVPVESVEPMRTLPERVTAEPLGNLGRYQVLEILGKGAMGTVYKGRDPDIDRLVALKTIRMDFATNREELKELRERLLREAKAAGRLAHPNIVTVYDVGHDGDVYYIAMEYLRGHTLEEVIKRKVELNFRIVATITTQVCNALEYAHDQGIVHRDIKPANIMVLNNFQVKVMDFGIARFDQSNMTQSGIALGTPNYISPEQLMGKQVDRRSDIFALGVVLYEFLTKRKPFTAENLSSLIYNIINTTPAPPSTVNDRIPEIFDRIVLKAIMKSPDERYQRAGEIAEDLKPFLATFRPKAKAF